MIDCAILVLGMWIGSRLLNGAQFPGRRWVIVLIALIIMLPWLFWEVFWPEPFEVTAYGDRVEYDFRDADVASIFAEENGTTAEETIG